MKFIKSSLKYLAFFILGILTSAFLVSTGVAYYATEELLKAVAPETKPAKKMPIVKASMISTSEFESEDASKPPNPNLKELAVIGLSYVTELDTFDQMVAQIAQKKAPDICSTLCNGTGLDRERLNTERSFYLAKFYKQEGARALQDPVFRIKLYETGLLSQAFPPSLRTVLKQVEAVKTLPPQEQPRFAMAMYLQTSVIKEATNFYFSWDAMKRSGENLKLLREWVKACNQGTPRKKVLAECQSHNFN